MRNYRFTISADDSINEDLGLIKLQNKSTLHQIINVLRLEKNSCEEISFIDGSGWIYICKIKEKSKNLIEFNILSKTLSTRELNSYVKFLIPIIKPEAFSLMVQKLTEIGIQELQPIYYERSQEPYLKSFIKHREKLNAIIHEATEQSQGARFTILNDYKKLLEIEDTDSYALKLFAYEALAGIDSEQVLKNNSKKILLAIGPEGGLTNQEVELFKEKGFSACSLGKRLLKAETAAISLASRMELN
jgi:16S rRNA (uracil1498-N3)-methyltransferase